MRPVLLRVLTDLFISRGAHTREERRQYEAIALGLIDKSDAATLEIVAGKLARFGAAPPAVVEKFLLWGGVPALEFLRHSSQLPRERILAAVGSEIIAEAVAIAGRADLDETAARALLSRTEIEIARALAANPVAPIPDDLAAALIARGRGDEILGRELSQRYGDPALIAPLFLWASPMKRAAILLAARRAHLGSLTRALPDFNERLNSSEIERAALLGDRPLLAALLARALGCALPRARDIVDDVRGEPLALALAALRVPGEVAARIFMRLDPAIAHSHERVRALSDLVFDAPPLAARSIVDAMLGKPAEKRRAVHAPVADMAAEPAPSRPAGNARAAPASRRPILLLRRRV